MVEAAVVIPVMLVFFGVMAHAYAAAKAKLVAQQDARASVMYFATNDCQKRLATDERSTSAPTGEALPTGGPSTALGDRAAGGSMEARASWSFAEGGASHTATVFGRSRTANSESWAVCNESPNTGNLAGLASYAVELFGARLPDPIRRAAR